MEVVVDDEADELREEDEERIAGRVGMLGEDIILAHAAGEERLVPVERGLGERVAAADGDDEEEDAEEPLPAARERGRGSGELAQVGVHAWGASVHRRAKRRRWPQKLGTQNANAEWRKLRPFLTSAFAFCVLSFRGRMQP